MDNLPRFAVVGHPNKGKSSIVATLTQDDQVAIAMEPGTTRDSRDYPLTVDGDELYRLIDTPGFQRPRRVLAWLQNHSASAADRAETVAAFVTQHRDDPRFHDECELLTPIINGAGIIYVVDGSVPYSPEHEAEMNILRWTGQPSMALINAIGGGDYHAQWQAALGQYFRIVRRFNAVTAPFAEQLALLDSFAALAPAWQAPLQQARQHLQALRLQRAGQASLLISEALAEMLNHRQQGRAHPGENTHQLQQRLSQQWQRWQRQREQQLRQQIEQLYQHHHLLRNEAELEQLLDEDLFSSQSRQRWGASRGYLTTVGMAAGALGGAGLDGLSGGATLGAGTLFGALTGAAGGFYYGERLGKLRRLLPGGGEQHQFGPVRDPQFGYVLLGRALLHWFMVQQRNHAGRQPLRLPDNDGHWLQQLNRSQQRQLHLALGQPPRHSGEQRRQQRLQQAISDACAAFTHWQQQQRNDTP